MVMVPHGRRSAPLLSRSISIFVTFTIRLEPQTPGENENVDQMGKCALCTNASMDFLAL